MSLVLNTTVFDEDVCRYHDDERKLYINPHELFTLTSIADIDNLIQRKVALLVQQCCSTNGFVLSGVSSTRNKIRSNRSLYKPLQIVSRSVGEIPPEHLNGVFLYKICYRIFVCNPSIGKILPVTVLDKNKVGIRCHYYPYAYDAENNEVATGDVIRAAANFIIVFLPKALHYNKTPLEGHPEQASHAELYDQEEARIDSLSQTGGDTQAILHIKVLQKRFDINDKQISVVGVLSTDGYNGDAYPAPAPKLASKSTPASNQIKAD
jgi:hypothetical protein